MVYGVVTEVCVQYVKGARFAVGGRDLPMQEWLRHEWIRSGLPLSEANEACGVKNAATRKYVTRCHRWYYPPADAFANLADYANRHGLPEGRPYFSQDGCRPLSGQEWGRLRAKFYCAVGVHNVWREGQPRVDVYAGVPNLKGQVLRDARGPLPEEASLEWVPGYILYRTAKDYADGRHVTGIDVVHEVAPRIHESQEKAEILACLRIVVEHFIQ